MLEKFEPGHASLLTQLYRDRKSRDVANSPAALVSEAIPDDVGCGAEQDRGSYDRNRGPRSGDERPQAARQEGEDDLTSQPSVGEPRDQADGKTEKDQAERRMP